MIKIAIELLKISNSLDSSNHVLSTEIEQIADMLKFAGLDEVLDSMDLNSEMIEFIKSQDSKDAGRMIGLLKQRPDITIDELKERVQKKEKTLTDNEKAIINRFQNNPEFYKWLEREVRRNRIQQKSEHEYLYSWGELNNIPDLQLIFDWFNLEGINISSYSFEAANENQKLWHKQFGKSKRNYGEINPYDIVYGPEWNNQEYNGWTIQLITTEKDLKAEGDKMHHCVGGYWNEVKDGNLKIYSLRDPDNHPHVTIGITGKSKVININNDDTEAHKIEQIYGYRNSEPKKEYKLMIKEWITNTDDILIVGDSHAKNPPIQNMDINQLLSIAERPEDLRLYGEYGELLIDKDDYAIHTINVNLSNEITPLSYEELTDDEREKIDKLIHYILLSDYKKHKDDWEYFKHHFETVDSFIQNHDLSLEENKMQFFNFLKNEQNNKSEYFENLSRRILNENDVIIWKTFNINKEQAILAIYNFYKEILSHSPLLSIILNDISKEVGCFKNDPRCSMIIDSIIKNKINDNYESSTLNNEFPYTELLLRNVYKYQDDFDLHKFTIKAFGTTALQTTKKSENETENPYSYEYLTSHKEELSLNEIKNLYRATRLFVSMTKENIDGSNFNDIIKLNYETTKGFVTIMHGKLLPELEKFTKDFYEIISILNNLDRPLTEYSFDDILDQNNYFTSTIASVLRHIKYFTVNELISIINRNYANVLVDIIEEAYKKSSLLRSAISKHSKY